MTNRMQVDRRKDAIPWTWEPFVGLALVYVFAVLVTAQVARGLAYVLAGGGWRWPTPENQVTSAFAILAGRSAAGLPGSDLPVVNPVLLYICLGIAEAVVVVALTTATVVAFLRFGPARLQGMASRAGAQRLLGTSRIRTHASVIRPDLYGRRAERRRRSQAQPRSVVAVISVPGAGDHRHRVLVALTRLWKER